MGPCWLPLLPLALAKAVPSSPAAARRPSRSALDLDGAATLEHSVSAAARIRPTARVDLAAMTALAERKPKARTVPAGLKALKDHIPLIEQLIDVS